MPHLGALRLIVVCSIDSQILINPTHQQGRHLAIDGIMPNNAERRLQHGGVSNAGGLKELEHGAIISACVLLSLV